MGKNLIYFGIGLIVASLLSMVFKPAIPDTEVVRRAEQMGMGFTEQIESELYQKIEQEVREQISIESNKGSQHNENTNTILISIPSGASGTQVEGILTQLGFNGEEFLLRINELGLASSIKFGEYFVDSEATIDELITILTN